ncbi:hypothetical protein BDM02DRAFT_2993998 [Thelephora ganbajun]|uniref:Uncharacterized protein n=1 Tax=Thelephora ganbajun TaxID=370292 RepID=A0ACB6ZA33_THEGA|nr:hypothetical protein BDM02DRAFT_2993998 [Thelephora ganbajun]
MSLRHPWFSQTLKRKHPDDLLSSEGSSGCGIGSSGGFGIAGTVFGGLGTNACSVGQVSPSSQSSNSNGRATKRFRKFESRNLERGLAELSIRPTPHVPSPPPHIQQRQQQEPDVQVGGDGVWSNVVGNAGQSSSVVCPDGSTLPLLRSSSVDEPPSPDLTDVQMSTPTWYEPEKDRIIITSLDDDEYDGDDEGQQQQRTGTKISEFTISPAFLNAINKKLKRRADPPTLPTDASTSQALVLFQPLPTITPPPVEDDPKGSSSHREGMLDSSLSRPPPASPSVSSPFYVQGSSEQPPLVSGDDDMEIEML